MSLADFAISAAFCVFIAVLIYAQRPKPYVVKRSKKQAIADAVARASADPPPVSINRPSRRGKR